MEHAIAHIEESIQGKVAESKLRWYAIKVCERDHKVYESLKLDDELISHLDEHIKDFRIEKVPHDGEAKEDTYKIIIIKAFCWSKKIIGCMSMFC